MPPRPFPFALRIGTDIVSQSRIRDVITRKPPTGGSTQLDAFLRRVFTEREQRVFWARFQGFDVGKTARLPLVTAHLAGRWAAKEAAIKAVKPRKLTHLDVEILQQPETRELYALIRDQTFVPRLRGLDARHAVKRLKLTQELSTTSDEPGVDIESGAQQRDPDDASGQIAKISISHDTDYATAVCMATEDPIPGDVGGEATARLYFNS